MTVQWIRSGIKHNMRKCGAGAADLKQKWAYVCLCSGLEATLKRQSAYAVPVQRIWCESDHMWYPCSGFEATLKRKSAYAVPVQRIWFESEHMRYLCNGFEATLRRKSANVVPVQRIWCECHHMRCLCSGFGVFGQVRRQGRRPLVGRW